MAINIEISHRELVYLIMSIEPDWQKTYSEQMMGVSTSNNGIFKWSEYRLARLTEQELVDLYQFLIKR